MAKRKPKYLGTGIHVHDQFNKNELVKGDTFFDADYGMMIWTGSQWANKSEKIMKKKPSKKQLAWRKKFAAMAKQKSKASKKKKRSKINGTTSIKIPTKRKNKTVHLQRNTKGRFAVISGNMYTVRDKLESEINYNLKMMEDVKRHIKEKYEVPYMKKKLKALRRTLTNLKKQLRSQNNLISKALQ